MVSIDVPAVLVLPHLTQLRYQPPQECIGSACTTAGPTLNVPEKVATEGSDNYLDCLAILLSKQYAADGQAKKLF